WSQRAPSSCSTCTPCTATTKSLVPTWKHSARSDGRIFALAGHTCRSVEDPGSAWDVSTRSSLSTNATDMRLTAHTRRAHCTHCHAVCFGPDGAKLLVNRRGG